MNPVVFRMLLECAETEQIPYTVEAAPRGTSTDADAIHNALRGIPTGLVSVPNRYMHSPVELVSLKDLEQIPQLMAAFARSLGSGESFKVRI